MEKRGHVLNSSVRVDANLLLLSVAALRFKQKYCMLLPAEASRLVEIRIKIDCELYSPNGIFL